MSEAKRKVFVTGGSGFIGTHLVEQLRLKGWSCLNYDKTPPLDITQKESWIEGDILNVVHLERTMREYAPDFVVHLAAKTDLTGKTEGDYRENTIGTENVLQSSDRAEVDRVVVASTMYVCQRGYIASSDDDYSVDTVYGMSKVKTEEITRHGDWSFDWIITRPAVIWGPFHMRMRREFFRIMSSGLYFHPGKSRVNRSYGYVENTAWQIIRLLEVLPEEVSGKTFYLADPSIDLYDWVNECSLQLRGKRVKIMPMSILRTIAVFGDALQYIGISGFPLTSFRLANMTNSWTINAAPIEAVAGMVPVNMKEGVRRTVNWLSA